MFRLGVMRRALAREGAMQCTDESQAVEALGLAPRLVRGSAANIKITYPGDLPLASAILSAQSAYDGSS
jgi:2-C-methyl-D-erythritol 4-phosphate cytidylyltransferase